MDIEEGNKGMLVLVALQILPSWVTLARRTTAPYILSASSPAMMTKNTNVMTMSRLGFTANWQLFCELSWHIFLGSRLRTTLMTALMMKLMGLMVVMVVMVVSSQLESV